MGTRILSETTVAVEPAVEAPKTPLFYFKGWVDIPLLLVMVVFIAFGLLMVYSSSWDYSLTWYGDPMYQFFRQIIWMGIAIAIGGVASFMDYHFWKKFVLIAMLGTITFLTVQLISSKLGIGGTGRGIFNGSYQPSELAKVISVIYLAVWLDSKREQLHDIWLGIIPMGIIIGFIGSLILIQPDISAGLTIFILGGLLFALGGGDGKQIITLIILFAIVAILFVKVNSYGQSRLTTYWLGIIDPTQAADHVIYSFEAIVKGGWFGVGIGLANTKLVGLPFASTDSVFAVIAEELGLVGATFTVFLYLMILWRGLRIAFHAPDMMGSLLAAGLTIWITMEALINMLVMVGLFPFAGNALPFISYGGSSLFSAFLGIGILMSVSRQTEPESEKKEWRSFGESFDLRGRNRRRSLSRVSRS